MTFKCPPSPNFNSVRNELAQIFAVINQSRSTETDGGSCIYLAQPKIRSGTFLAAALGRLGLVGRGNLAMHMGLLELRWLLLCPMHLSLVDLHQAPYHGLR